MIEINYNKFLEITNMSKETYKATSIKRKIKSLESNGFKVVEIKNKGVNAIFICEQSQDVVIKQQLEELLKVEIKHPLIMNKYLELLCNNDESFLFKTDAEVVELLKEDFNYEFETLKKYINQCRKELIKANWMKKIVRSKYDTNASKRKYLLKNKDSKEIKEIDIDEFNSYYKNIYYKRIKELKSKISEVVDATEDNSELNKLLGSEARKYLTEQINGNLFISYKKDFKIGGFKEGE